MKKQTKLKAAFAPWNKRGFAFLIDWYLGSAFSTIPAGLLWNMLTGEEAINTDLTLFKSPYGLLAGLLGLLFGAVYYYIIPLWAWEGQTVGKKLMGIKIVDENGQPLSTGKLAIRQLAGVMLLEGAFMLTGNYFTQIVSMLTFDMAGKALNYISSGMLTVSAILVFKSNMAVHDYLARSKVIENKKI